MWSDIGLCGLSHYNEVKLISLTSCLPKFNSGFPFRNKRERTFKLLGIQLIPSIGLSESWAHTGDLPEFIWRWTRQTNCLPRCVRCSSLWGLSADLLDCLPAHPGVLSGRPALVGFGAVRASSGHLFWVRRGPSLNDQSKTDGGELSQVDSLQVCSITILFVLEIIQLIGFIR